VIEIGNDEIGDEDDGLALIPHSSTSSSIKALLVVFYFYYYFLYSWLYYQIQKKSHPLYERQEDYPLPQVCSRSLFSIDQVLIIIYPNSEQR
jgi:hypothetical protein